MLDCAIAGCKAQELTLRSGTLHLLDVPTNDNRIVKRVVWLCSDCSDKYVVQTWRPVGQQIRLREFEHPSIVMDSPLPARSVISIKTAPSWKRQRSAA